MKGDSLRRQTELSTNYAEQHGLILDTTLNLKDLGLSAYDRSNIERGALGQFLKLVEEGRIEKGSYLLVESLDRLSRDQVTEALEVFLSILRRGITIVTLSDAMVYNHQSVNQNSMSLMQSILVMQRAHEESLTKSRRIRAAWDNKRANIGEKKLTARCPSWLKLNDDRKSFSFVPDKVEVVKEILAWSKSGLGQSVIVKRLHERGEKPWSNHGNGWHTSYINKILNSPALHGEFQPQIWRAGRLTPFGDPIPDYFPALLSKEDFLARKAERNLREFSKGIGRKGGETPNLLGGVGKCGYCGGSMVMTRAAAPRITKANEGQPRPTAKVLVCDNGRRGLGCWAVRWNYQDLERSFLSFCKGLDLQSLIDDVNKTTLAQDAIQTLQTTLQQTNATLADNKAKIAKLIAAIEAGVATDSVTNRIVELEQENVGLEDAAELLTEQLQQRQSAASTNEAEMQTIRSAIDQLADATGDDLLLLRASIANKIRRLIDKVEIHPAGKLHTKEHIEKLSADLNAAGYTPARIAKYLESLHTEPKRMNHVKGRYASRRDSGRFFVIRSKNGSFRAVVPDFDDPTAYKLDMSADRTKDGMELNLRTNLKKDKVKQ